MALSGDEFLKITPIYNGGPGDDDEEGNFKMNKPLTSRQRMITAMRNKIPDRVPVSPDISNMIPARLTGKPFWEIYVYDNPNLGEAYMDAVRYYGMDGWFLYGGVVGGNTEFPLVQSDVEFLFYDNISVPKELVTKKIVSRDEEKLIEQWVVHTPLGDVEQSTAYYRFAPPWDVTNFVKNIKEDWPKVRWLMGENWHWDTKKIDFDLIGNDEAVYGLQVHSFVDFWDGIRNGSSEQMIFDFYDEPDLMHEIWNYFLEFTKSRTRGLCKAGVDEILMQGSNSSMSLINPQIYREYILPVNREISKICREEKIICHLHTCGRSREVVEMNCAEEPLFDVIEPLEKPPSGNVNIAKVKRKYGKKCALKGNLLTSGNLVRGTPKQVEQEVIETLKAAGEGGGFILSTGDQVGGNTPDENLFAMVEAGKKYGVYLPDGRLKAFIGEV